MVKRWRSVLEYVEHRFDERALGRGPEHQFHCPFCLDSLGDESNKRKFGINVKKAVGGCYRCGEGFRSWEGFFRKLNGGTLRIDEIQLLRFEPEMPKEDVAEAVERLLYVADDEEKTPTHLKRRRLPPETVKLWTVSAKGRKSMRLRQAFKYLKEKRGAEDDLLKTHSIGYCATGDHAQHLIFPVQQGGSQTYFTSRYAGDTVGMKSKNPENAEGYFTRSSCLVGFDRCVGIERIALVEGPFDMMAYRYAVAMMGKFLSDDQLDLIRLLVMGGLREIVVSLDPGAGREMDAAYRVLLPIVPEVSCLALDGGDPWSRRVDLPVLLDGRGAPDTGTRVRQRLGLG